MILRTCDISRIASRASEARVFPSATRCDVTARFSPLPFIPKPGDSHIASGPSGGKFLPCVHPFGGTNERGTANAESKTTDNNTAIIKKTALHQYRSRSVPPLGDVQPCDHLAAMATGGHSKRFAINETRTPLDITRALLRNSGRRESHFGFPLATRLRVKFPKSFSHTA